MMTVRSLLFAAAFLVFGVQGLNAFYGKSHHRLVADLSCQCLVVHARYVEVSLATVDTGIGWRSAVAKGLLEATHRSPPIQRFCGVRGRQNGDGAFDDRFHWRSINEPGEIRPFARKAARQFEIMRGFP